MAAAKKKATAKKTAATTGSTKRSASKKAATKRSGGAKATTKKAASAQKPATRTAATKRSPATKKAATKKAPATKKASASKKAATKPAATKSAGAKRSPKSAPPATSKPSAAKRTARPTKKKASGTTPMASTAPQAAATAVIELPKPRFNKDGLGYTKDFDLSFIKGMHDALQDERVRLTGQAKRLEDEAHQLVEEAEMGDVQFDDEGGEGDTMVVERERDLALSAQAREAVDEIDAALSRITKGTYGYSLVSGRPIPRERLEAIPWSTELVEEKVGGIGRR